MQRVTILFSELVKDYQTLWNSSGQKSWVLVLAYCLIFCMTLNISLTFSEFQISHLLLRKIKCHSILDVKVPRRSSVIKHINVNLEVLRIREMLATIVFMQSCGIMKIYKDRSMKYKNK